MKNKWRASQVRAAQQWLQETWPALFSTGRDLKPLSLKVHKSILQHPTRPADISRRALVEALKRHTRSFGYLFGVTKHTHRYDLDLQPVEPIAEQHRQWAQKTLRRQQKLSQAAKRKSTAERVVGSPLRTPSARKNADTTITYKKARRRLIVKPAMTRNAPTGSVAA